VAGVLAALEECLQEVGSAALKRIGVGFGGPVDYARGVILTSHHVSQWDGYPLRQELAARFGAAVRLDNDANVGALGEARYGAGRGHANLVYVNAGTGIGAGLVLGGRIYRGANGLAGELGHVTVDDGPEARPCACGKRGCLEAYASGRAIGGPEVTRRAKAGDEGAQGRLRDAVRALARALGAATNLLNPSAIVVGGGVAEAGELLLGPLRTALARELMPDMPAPAVVPAALGYDAGVIGALALASED
jgi:predicted NBD/HSP70 family sugar kinase